MILTDMTRLVSKWASDENLAPAPRKHQPFHAQNVQSASPAHTPKPTKLVSKWADAPDPELEPHPKKSPRTVQAPLPSPPPSAGKNHDQPGARRRSEASAGRFTSMSHSNEHKPAHKHPEPADARRKSSVPETGHVLARRLGGLELSGGKSFENDVDLRPKKGPTGWGPKTGKSHPRRYSDNGSDEEYSKGPMTAAAKSMALRIGVPTNVSNPPHSRINDKNSKPKPADNETNALGSKYRTPTQKRALEEEKNRAQLAKEQELKEASLRAEVQSMFEKMSDTTLSWADLEDDE